jgi:ELWxxDGT repeat protein
VNDLLFFAADDGVHGRELWRSDGTAAGTFMVKDLVPGPSDSYPTELSAVGRWLYFSAADDASGTELWRSDGTPAGTTLVADVGAGALPSWPAEIRPAGGRLFFVADDGVAGREPWVAPLPGTLWTGDAEVVEGNVGLTTAVFTVTLTTPNTTTVTVSYATADGTARAPSDYLAVTGTLSFPPGVTTRTITVPVNGDSVDEPHESFFLRLSNAVGADLVDAEGEGVIRDDDGPSASIADLTVTEGSNGTTSAAVIVTLSAPSAQGISVDYTTTSATATAPADYAASSGRLDFAPGTASATVTVPVVADTMDEFDETFLVTLSHPQNATLADDQATVTIVDDDAPPILSVGDVTLLEGNQGMQAATFTATLSAPSGKTVGAQFATRDGTASASSDYAASSGAVSFAPGTTSRAVAVAVNGDTTVEPDETFLLDLSNAVNATLGVATGTATILDDDLGRGFHPLTPCRLVDTRGPAGPSGGPALAANSSRAFPVTGVCLVPSTARAVAVNVVAVNPGAAGNLRLYPAGSATPNASVLNFREGRTRAGHAIATLGAGGGIAVRCDMPTGSAAASHLVLDIYGYFE